MSKGGGSICNLAKEFFQYKQMGQAAKNGDVQPEMFAI